MLEAMWGEIEPRVKTQPNPSNESNKDDRSTTPETPAVVELRFPSIVPQEPLEDTQNVPAHVSALLEVVVVSGSQVKSQQMGDAELTPEERKRELLLQYRSKPLVFLERYHSYLKPEHLRSFSHVSADPRTQHYAEVIHRRAAESTNRTRVRNQRYAALRALQKGGQYFSEEEMRTRAPLLYEQYIGQYLTDEEVLERSQGAMLDGAHGGPEVQGGVPGGLAHLLLNSYQERLTQGRLQEEQEREDNAEEEDEEEEDAGVQEKTWEPTNEEKALLREEFISQMHQRFLNGNDKDFNYSEVDENPDFDNLDIVSRDAEEKYFDEDDEEEDEDEEMTQ
ncbi:coiled-coil domain-containing protein 97 [Entelurus aequoreus]|uniref:coiled-coil domain-containing protein 97 n=1 Tax=Entelurus aequoreus TaxID=161455 RepID=UPI002B1D764D|nr:coiled-coil domain-containing protein 97 [Entelurus aequoreus]